MRQKIFVSEHEIKEPLVAVMYFEAMTSIPGHVLSLHHKAFYPIEFVCLGMENIHRHQKA